MVLYCGLDSTQLITNQASYLKKKKNQNSNTVFLKYVKLNSSFNKI